MAIGCFLGSIIWWTILGGVLFKNKDKLSNKTLERIRLGSSGIIGVFGISGVVSSLLKCI